MRNGYPDDTELVTLSSILDIASVMLFGSDVKELPNECNIVTKNLI